MSSREFCSTHVNCRLMQKCLRNMLFLFHGHADNLLGFTNIQIGDSDIVLWKGNSRIPKLGMREVLSAWSDKLSPSVSKWNLLHVVIFWIFFNNLRNILQMPLKWSAIFLESWTSTGCLSDSTGSLVTSSRFSPFVVPNPLPCMHCTYVDQYEHLAKLVERSFCLLL